jgi:hypothetical protein
MFVVVEWTYARHIDACLPEVPEVANDLLDLGLVENRVDDFL